MVPQYYYTRQDFLLFTFIFRILDYISRVYLQTSKTFFFGLLTAAPPLSNTNTSVCNSSFFIFGGRQVNTYDLYEFRGRFLHSLRE